MLRKLSEEPQKQKVRGIRQTFWCCRWFGSALVRERSLAAGLQQTMLLAGTSCGRRSLAGHEVLLARCLSHGAKQSVPPDKKASRRIPHPNIISALKSELKLLKRTLRLMKLC